MTAHSMAGSRLQHAKPLAAVVWPLALGSFTYRCVVLPAAHLVAGDMYPWWNGIRVWLDGQQPYADLAFVYPPSALLLLLPFGLFDFNIAKFVFLLCNLSAIVTATFVVLHIFRIKWYSWQGALSIFGLSLSWPVYATLESGNVNGIIFCLESWVLWSIVHHRRILASCLLGISFAIKPVLPLLLLLFIMKRWFSHLLIAAAVPALFSLAASLWNGSSLDFFLQTLSFLLGGNNAELQAFNVALTGISYRFPSAAWIVAPSRVIVVLLVAVMAKKIFRSQVDDKLRLLEISGLLLIATFLCAPASWRYYGVYLIPLLISVVHPGARMRHPLAWLGVYFVFTLDVWTSERLPSALDRIAQMLPTFGYLLVLLAFYMGWSELRVYVGWEGLVSGFVLCSRKLGIFRRAMNGN